MFGGEVLLQSDIFSNANGIASNIRPGKACEAVWKHQFNTICGNN
jgi:hypothetical protein